MAPEGFRLFWTWQSRPRGRPRVPVNVQRLIVEMAKANLTWGEERIAAELLLKLGIRVSPRTVRRYMPSHHGTGPRVGSQQWSTFVRNHAQVVLACDFFVAVTVRFRLLYVFVVMEVGTRRILYWNVTEHPTAEWTLQQFRMVAPGDQPHRFVIHDRATPESRARHTGSVGADRRAVSAPPTSSRQLHHSDPYFGWTPLRVPPGASGVKDGCRLSQRAFAEDTCAVRYITIGVACV
jgi:hypothetical protein